jgi:hypothetical protein
MSIRNGYKYNTEESAILAKSACAAHYGIPINDTNITQEYVEYYYASQNSPVFWYILYAEPLLPVLGEPTEFQLNDNML